MTFIFPYEQWYDDLVTNVQANEIHKSIIIALVICSIYDIFVMTCNMSTMDNF